MGNFISNFRPTKVRDIFRKFQNDWNLKASKKKWQFLYDIPRTMFELVGVRVFSDCHLNWYSHLGNVLVAYYTSMCIYTLYYYYKKGDFLFGTQCLVGTGILISSVPLYYRAIGKQRFRLNSLLNFAGRYVYQENRDSSKFNDVCEMGVQKMWRSFAILTVIICFSMTTVAIGPLLVFFRTGVWNTPLGIQFPYADVSNVAFWLDLGIQVVVAMIGVLTTVSIEMSSVIVNNCVELFADVIELNINELSLKLETDKEFRPRTKQLFENITIQIQDYDRYIQEFSTIFYYRFFCGPFALTFSVAFAFFTQYHWDFPGGYGSSLAAYIQLLILCYMGYNVKKSNEIICASLDRIPFYILPLKYQKELIHLMHRMQNGVVIRIGPLAELDYEMASTITKKIYSFLAMLLNFIE